MKRAGAALLLLGLCALPASTLGYGYLYGHQVAAPTQKGPAAAVPAAYFNGEDAWAGVNDPTFPGGDLTVSYWMRLGGHPPTGTYPLVWSKSEWSVALVATGIRTYNHTSGTRQAVWPYPQIGEWHHYLITYNSTDGWECWIDGSSATAVSTAGTLAAIGGDEWFSLNAYSATTYPTAANLDWQFDIAEMGAWNADLGASAATELYNGGSPLDIRASSFAGTALHRWGFADATTVVDDIGSDDLTLANVEVIEDAFTPVDQWEAVTLGGQSVAVGTTGTTPAINLHPPVATYPVNVDGSLVLRAHDGFERPEVAMSYTLSYLRNRRLIFQNIAVNGTAYAGLMQGTTPYNTGITGLGTMATTVAARPSRGAIRHIAFAIIHGESDEIAGTTVYGSTYLPEWQADWDTDARAATGQTEAIPLVQSQMSRLPSYPDVADIAIQQWEATKANPGAIYLVGPKYQHTYVDTWHVDAASSAAIGAKMGQALASIAAGNGWTPLSPASVTGAGTDTIVLDLDVPFPPVVFDTSTLSAVTDYGFEVSDGGGAAISSVTLTDATEGVITIVLDQALTTNPRLRYVYTAASAAAYHGNVRDSDSTDLGPHTTSQYNWLVHFDEAVN